MKLFNAAVALASVIAPLFSSEDNVRKADYPIENVFIERQSKYAFCRTLTPGQMKLKLMSLFEAARWAASSYNHQPWRFIYGVHGSKSWTKLYDLVVPGNQKWAEHAGALILVVSLTKSEQKNSAMPTHSFDTGLAVGNLLTQATHLDLATHTIGGFDHDKARKEFKIPQKYHIDAMIAIGEPAKKETLKDTQKEHAAQDAKPSGRKKVAQIAGEGVLIL